MCTWIDRDLIMTHHGRMTEVAKKRPHQSVVPSNGSSDKRFFLSFVNSENNGCYEITALFLFLCTHNAECRKSVVIVVLGKSSSEERNTSFCIDHLVEQIFMLEGSRGSAHPTTWKSDKDRNQFVDRNAKLIEQVSERRQYTIIVSTLRGHEHVIRAKRSSATHVNQELSRRSTERYKKRSNCIQICVYTLN